MTAESLDLERFYSLIDRISGRARRLTECSARSGWPRRGVYFFREPGEYRTGHPDVSRIVRVGTHAVSANAKSTLWSRLHAHRGHASGTGNHRGSVFRRHVGAAMIARDGIPLDSWGPGGSAPKAVRVAEEEHERRVSAYIGAMDVLWIEVDDAPSPSSARSWIERHAIALLSRRLHPPDPSSPDWLGRHAPADEIRRSGLWNVNYVDASYDSSFLDDLEFFIDAQTK